MSNRSDEVEEDDIPDTDFSGAVRGKYYERAIRGTNVVLLEADVAQVFSRFRRRKSSSSRILERTWRATHRSA